jgi:hypothetical protein
MSTGTGSPPVPALPPAFLPATELVPPPGCAPLWLPAVSPAPPEPALLVAPVLLAPALLGAT